MNILAFGLILHLPLHANTENSFALDRSHASSIDLDELVRLYPDAQNVNLSFSDVKNLEPLASLNALRLLDLSGCLDLEEDSLIILSKCKNLEALSLSKWNHVTDRGLKHLAGCTNLKYLDLSWNTELSEDCLTALPPSIKILSLLRCVQLKSLKSLAHLHDLQSLDLSHCTQLPEEALHDLLHLTIRHLYLWNWGQLTDEGLKHLGQMSSLTKLDISYCPQVTDMGLAALAPLIDLQCLSLSYNLHITDSGIRNLISCHPNLHNLDLHGCFQLSRYANEIVKIEY